MENDPTRGRHLPPRYLSSKRRTAHSPLQRRPPVSPPRAPDSGSGWTGSTYQTPPPPPPPPTGDSTSVGGSSAGHPRSFSQTPLGSPYGPSCYPMPPSPRLAPTSGGDVGVGGCSSSGNARSFSQPSFFSSLDFDSLPRQDPYASLSSFADEESSSSGLPPLPPSLQPVAELVDMDAAAAPEYALFPQTSLGSRSGSSFYDMTPLGSDVDERGSSNFLYPMSFSPVSPDFSADLAGLAAFPSTPPLPSYPDLASSSSGLPPLPPSMPQLPVASANLESADLDDFNDLVNQYLDMDDDQCELSSSSDGIHGVPLAGNQLTGGGPSDSNTMSSGAAEKNNGTLSAKSLTKLPPLPRQRPAAGSSRNLSSRGSGPSIDGTAAAALVAEFANGMFTEDDRKKILADKRLAEIVLSDPKRVRRILRDRMHSHNTKERKVKYTNDLERQCEHLQTETKKLNEQVQSAQSNANKLTTENNELRIRLEGMEQEWQLKKVLNETISAEVQRLKLVAGEINGSHISNSLNTGI